nr:hypothetical protein [Candidatus Cloacimonadota bacterium]
MKTEKIIKFIREHCSADDYVCSISNIDSHETRFAQNGITQHIAGPKISIDLTVTFGKKSGTASVNQADDATLMQLISTAEDIAKLAPEDPEFMPSTGSCKLPQVQNCSQATLDLKPQEMVKIVQTSIDQARAMDATVSGMCEKHISDFCLFTKHGFIGSDRNSSFGHSMTLKKGEVETKVSYAAKDFSGFDLKKDFARLAAQAESLADMHSFDPQKIAVILRPAALQELLWYMFWMMNRRQSDEGFTPFTDQLGKSFFGEKFSLYSTLQKPQIISPPFTMDGLPTEECVWVENGVLKNMPTDRYWASKQNTKACTPYNMYIPGGDASEDEMMKMVPRGLIINRFWYIRPVDMKRGELTGMTRDGVLYFENGKVKNAVNNLRFNEIPHEMTRRILALGAEELASPYGLVPTILIDGFNFVDKTNF